MPHFTIEYSGNLDGRVDMGAVVELVRKAAVETGIFPLYEVEDGVVRHYGKTKAIVEGRPRKPVREYLLKQGRFAHFTEEDLDYFQSKVDEMWDKWEIPGVIPFWKERPGAK